MPACPLPTSHSAATKPPQHQTPATPETRISFASYAAADYIWNTVMYHVVTFLAISIHSMKLICKYLAGIHRSLEFTNLQIIHNCWMQWGHHSQMELKLLASGTVPQYGAKSLNISFIFFRWHLGTGQHSIGRDCGFSQILSIIPAPPSLSSHLSTSFNLAKFPDSFQGSNITDYPHTIRDHLSSVTLIGRWHSQD